jgi:heme A synthase
VRLFRGLALGAAALAFLVAVLGSWVRINGAGLTCPDWPLCRGSVVPALSGGVVLEWSHRAGVFLEAFLVLGVLAAGWRLRAAVPGLGRGLAVLAGVFAVQVLLGGATVELGNSPISVVLHWAMAMALLATLTVLATLGFEPVRIGGAVTGNHRSAGALSVAAAFAFLAMCAGAYVSSSQAGLACPAFPLCGSEAFGSNEAQLAQMLHRLAALFVVLAASAAAAIAWTGGSARVRATAAVACALVFVQAALGAANVLAAMPVALRELHAANAGLTFIALVLAATFASLDPDRARSLAPQRARATGMASSR